MGVDFAVVVIFADLVFRAMNDIGMRTPAIFSENNMPGDFIVFN